MNPKDEAFSAAIEAEYGIDEKYCHIFLSRFFNQKRTGAGLASPRHMVF